MTRFPMFLLAAVLTLGCVDTTAPLAPISEGSTLVEEATTVSAARIRRFGVHSSWVDDQPHDTDIFNLKPVNFKDGERCELKLLYKSGAGTAEVTTTEGNDDGNWGSCINLRARIVLTGYINRAVVLLQGNKSGRKTQGFRKKADLSDPPDLPPPLGLQITSRKTGGGDIFEFTASLNGTRLPVAADLADARSRWTHSLGVDKGVCPGHENPPCNTSYDFRLDASDVTAGTEITVTLSL